MSSPNGVEMEVHQHFVFRSPHNRFHSPLVSAILALRLMNLRTSCSPPDEVWQVLPLNPTGYGDSPYQCFSAFAGNPLLVSLERLRDQGLLQARTWLSHRCFPKTSSTMGR